MFKVENEESYLQKLEVTKLNNVQKKFSLSSNFLHETIAFKGESQLIPQLKPNYQFVGNLTEGILAALNYNKRMMIYGLHGSGKSSHIEQVAAKLSWPVIRLNLDNEISRVELIGRDMLVNNNGKTEMVFKPGILTFAIMNPVILILDEYDAATPEALFIIQQLLETNGKLVVPETSQVIQAHQYFRLFATANTIGIGDESSLYQGTNILNQGQLDRWQIIEKLDYLDSKLEQKLLAKEYPDLAKDLIKSLVTFASLVRNSFAENNISLTLSTRNLLNIADNYQIWGDLAKALRVSLLLRFPSDEQEIIRELVQRVFAFEL